MATKRAYTKHLPNGATGLTVDYEGAPAIDPTKNVTELVDALKETISQLRDADTKFNDAQTAHIKEMAALRASHAETLRVSDLDRLDKTRQVDVLAGTASAAALATAVQTLAATSSRDAETIRNQLNSDRAALAKLVSDTAATLSTQNDSLMRDVNFRIAELQKASYTGTGKSSIADPQTERLSAMVEHIAKAQAESAGHSKFADPRAENTYDQMRELRAEIAAQSGQRRGAQDMAGWIVGGVSLLIAIGMLVAYVVAP